MPADPAYLKNDFPAGLETNAYIGSAKTSAVEMADYWSAPLPDCHTHASHLPCTPPRYNLSHLRSSSEAAPSEDFHETESPPAASAPDSLSLPAPWHTDAKSTE